MENMNNTNEMIIDKVKRVISWQIGSRDWGGIYKSGWDLQEYWKYSVS